MVVVHHLNERLNASSARNLSAGHGLGNLQGGLVNTSKDGVTVSSLSGVTLIEVLQNNGFTASEFTASDDDDFTRLQTKITK